MFYNLQYLIENYSEKEIIEMINKCPEIKDVTKEEIEKNINVLKAIECSERQIKNILLSNPTYLVRMEKDIINLVKKLKELGFDCLNILFDSNPYILNKDSFEIENYVKERIEEGEILEDIIDELDSNPYMFNEI